MTVQPQSTPLVTKQSLGFGGWVALIGITLGAVVGVALITLAILYATGATSLPTLPHGITMADVATMVAAGATLLLADFTALLAWVTRRSIDATQREADIAAAALTASNRQADIAEKALKTVQEQVDLEREQTALAREQATAANERARVEQARFAASTRPQLAEPRTTQFINATPDMSRDFEFEVVMVNLGPGTALVAKSFLALGSVLHMASAINPKIVGPNDEVRLAFSLSPGAGGISDQAIAEAMMKDYDLRAVALYSDITRQRAWRNRGRLIRRGSAQWLLTDVEVEDIGLNVLD